MLGAFFSGPDHRTDVNECKSYDVLTGYCSVPEGHQDAAALPRQNREENRGS